LIDRRLVSECGIQQGSTLHLIIRAAGGTQLNIKFQFNQIKNMGKIRYLHNGPKWRTVHPGISFSSKCKTEGCEAFKKSVIVNKEFGTFDLAETTWKLDCPLCKKRTEPATLCGFDKAKWKFEGILQNGKERVIIGETSSNDYHTFREGDNENWRYLKVTVESKEA